MATYDIKISYDSALEMYEDNLKFFNSDEITYAMEAEGGTEKTSENWFQRIIAKIEAMINNALASVSNWFNRIMETDTGFEKKLRQAELGKKPKAKVVVVGYKYNDAIVNNYFKKVKSFTDDFINKMKTVDVTVQDEKLAGKSKDIIIDIMKSCGSSMEDTSRFFDEFRTKFRGQKQELVIMNTEVKKYTQIYKVHQRFKDVMEKDMNSLMESIATIKNRLKVEASKIKLENKQQAKNSANSENKPEPKMEYAKLYLNNLAKIYNFNVSFYNFVLNLKVEEALSARAILKRFYYIDLN